MYPQSSSAIELSQALSLKYEVPVIPVNCLEITEDEIKQILTAVLFRFPVKEISVNLPNWVLSLDRSHWLRENILETVKNSASNISFLEDVSALSQDIAANENVLTSNVKEINLGDGSAVINTDIGTDLFFNILAESTGLEISGEQALMTSLIDLVGVKKEYEKIKGALEEVEATGYGIVMPSIDELTLKEPEIVKHGGKYGVRLRAEAPSIHLIKADITTEIAPVVGTESQSEELVSYLLKDYEEEPAQIWNSNIFGKSLNELVNEGLRNKLYHMPVDARGKLQETLERVINEGCNGLICIIL